MASDAVVNLIVDATQADNQINVQLRHIVNDAERNAPAINLTVNIDQRQINGLVSGLNDVQSSARGADDDSSRLSDTFRSLASVAGGIASVGASIGAIGVAAGGAVPLVAGLVTSLTNIAPAAAAGVTAFLAIKAASATLKLGLTGVSDALKAVFEPDADPEKVAEALKNLAPEARSFVLALQDMKPAFDDLRLDVQNKLFKDLDTSVSRVAKSVFPEARAAALSYADSFNTMGKQVATSVQVLDKEGSLGKALKGGTDAFKELESVPAQVTLAIGRLGAAGAPLLNRFADSISKVATSISVDLGQASESGALEDMVNAAGDALAQLGRIVGNVFGTLGNVLSVATTQGDGLFGTLEKVTQTLEDATSTQGFRDALGALISVAGTLADNVLPLVEEAFKTLGPVIETLAPPVERVLNLLGAELLALIPQVAPILDDLAESVGLLLDAVGPLIPVFGNLISAVLPVLPPLFDALNRIIVALTPVVGVMATTLADTLVPAITDLIPVIVELADFFAQLTEQIAPLAVEILPILLPLLNIFIVAMAEVLAATLPLISSFLDVGLAVTEQLIAPFRLVIGPVNDAITKLQEAATVLNGPVKSAVEIIGNLLHGDFSAAWNDASINVGGSTRSISDLVSTMSSRVIGYVRGLGSDTINAFQSSFNTVVRVVGEQLGNALDTVRRWGSQALGAIRGFGGEFRSAGAALIGGFVDGLLSQLDSAVSAASKIVGAVSDFFPHSPAKKGAFSGRGWTLYSGQAVVTDFAKGIESQIRKTNVDWSALGGSVPLGTSTASGTTAADAGQAAVASMFSSTFARTTPAVNVYLGNSLLTDHFQVMIDGNNQVQDRVASQGVRF